MESLPGTYALFLRARQAQVIQVGRQGSLEVQPGWYVYLGSAFGPGGLRARVGRHLHGNGAIHWHIDYLRRVTTVEVVWYTLDSTPQEHAWAQAFAHLPAAAVPLPGFGSSGCPCPSHLFFLPGNEALSPFDRQHIHLEGVISVFTVK